MANPVADGGAIAAVGTTGGVLWQAPSTSRSAPAAAPMRCVARGRPFEENDMATTPQKGGSVTPRVVAASNACTHARGIRARREDYHDLRAPRNRKGPTMADAP